MSTALASQNATPPAPAGTGARKLTERAFRIRESGIIVVLVVFVAVTASVQPRFLNITNIQFILVNTTVFALLALGETMVVISRNYDLSVGSVLGLSAYLSASLFGGHPGFPIPLAFLAGLGIGCAETAQSASVAVLAPAELRGSAFGLLATGQACANLIASALAGILWSAISPIAAFIFLAAAMLVALPLILTSKID
jgi:rhamnose transport system permease protein